MYRYITDIHQDHLAVVALCVAGHFSSCSLNLPWMIDGERNNFCRMNCCFRHWRSFESESECSMLILKLGFGFRPESFRDHFGQLRPGQGHVSCVLLWRNGEWEWASLGSGTPCCVLCVNPCTQILKSARQHDTPTHTARGMLCMTNVCMYICMQTCMCECEMCE